VSIFRANLVRQLDDSCQFSAIEVGLCPYLNESGKDAFGGDVAYEFVSGEGTSAQASQGGIEPAATSFISGENLASALAGRE